MKRVFGIILVLALLMSIHSCDTPEGGIEFNVKMNKLGTIIPCSDTLNEPYGICSHITRKNYDYPYIDNILDILEELNITWVRSDMDWYSVSNEPGKMDYTFFDEMFTHFEKHPQIHLLPIVVYSGNYVLSSSSGLQIKEYYKEWLEYVDGIVSRYHTFCPVWEGLNEMVYWANIGEIGYADVVQYQSDIYDIVKKTLSRITGINKFNLIYGRI